MNKGPRILVADDMQMIRRLLKSTLLKAGLMDVDEAGDGEEILGKLKHEAFDLIICDWEMPKLSGIETLRAIRSDETHKDTPFVMVTTVAEREMVRSAIDAGINDYIVKPIQPEIFTRKIKSILTELKLLPATA